MATRAPRKRPGRGVAPEPAPPGGADMLQSGLKAAAARNPLFDAFFGLDAAHKQRQKELCQWPTFEDLFDQRVARALEHLGATGSIEALRTQLAELDERLCRIERLLDPPRGRAKR